MPNFNRVILSASFILLLIGCRQKPVLGYQCSGAEPFWTIDFKDGEFFFNSMDGGEALNLGYAEPQIFANPRRIVYSFENGELSLEPATSGCAYDLSGEGNYPFTATFVYNEIPYKGCGREVRESK